MRAHLLQTSTNERDDALLDCAANDAQFAKTHSDAALDRPELSTVPATTQIVSASSQSDNDDYWLGGYAGI